MGGWPSKASATTATATTSTNAAAQQQQRQQRRERLLQTHGIFVPPAFAVSLHNNDNDDPSFTSPARTQARYQDGTTHATTTTNNNDKDTAWRLRLLPHSQSCVAAAQHVDAGQRILQDYLTPGVWWQSVSSSSSLQSSSTTVLASLSSTTSSSSTAATTVDDDDDNGPTHDTRKNAKKNDKNDTRNTTTRWNQQPQQQQPYGGRILVAKQVSDNVTVRLQGSSNGTTTLPRWTCHWYVGDAFTLSASSNVQGQEGWLAGRYQGNFNRPISNEQGIRIEAASIVPWHFQSTSSSTSSTRNNHHLLGNHVFLTGSLSPWSSSSPSKRNGWKLAVDTKVQLDNPTWQTTDTRFFGSMYLQDQDDSSSDHNNNNNNSNNTYVSPVELSLQVDSQQSAVALTQRLAFDRIQLNVLDNRAPLVRNTLGWTLRMEQPLSSSSPLSSLSSNKKNSPKVTLGAVWQLNRATAIKAVWHNDQQSLTTALIGKRWKHPRVTCSVLGRYHVPTRSATWLGVSLEVETGQFPPDAAAAAAADRGSSGSPPPPPPTQIQLPPGVRIDE